MRLCGAAATSMNRRRYPAAFVRRHKQGKAAEACYQQNGQRCRREVSAAAATADDHDTAEYDSIHCPLSSTGECGSILIAQRQVMVSGIGRIPAIYRYRKKIAGRASLTPQQQQPKSRKQGHHTTTTDSVPIATYSYISPSLLSISHIQPPCHEISP